MSYCRFGDDSDVNMYPTGENEICCCACQLKKGGTYNQEEALEHLEHHRVAGHMVKQHAIDRLKREIRGKG